MTDGLESGAGAKHPASETAVYCLMMILRSSAASPFVRKVRIASNLLGLDDRIAVRGVDLNDPADSIRAQNPLGQDSRPRARGRHRIAIRA
jgi:Glutathione S-transferase, N-terminal domain